MSHNAATDALAAMTDEESAIADALRDAVESPSNVEGLSRSVACRKAKVAYNDTASRLLHLMAAAGHIDAAGNGAWTRYFPVAR